MELPTEARLRWILRQCARLTGAGAEPVSGLVLPTSEFFPDRFDRSPASLDALAARVLTLAGLSDLPMRLEVAAPEQDGHGHGCSSGGCGCSPAGAKARLQRLRPAEDGHGYVVTVAAGEIGHSVMLTAALVRAVAAVFLREARLWGSLERTDREPATDLAGVLLGFGVLLANGSYIYSKGCGGVHVSSVTALPADELGVGLAIFAQLNSVAPGTAAAHLDPTPRSHFEQAMLWARSNAGVIGLLRSDRKAIAADSYALNEARGWLSRLLGIGRSRKPSAPTDDELEQVAKDLARRKSRASTDEAKSQRLRELRELVDEALER